MWILACCSRFSPSLSFSLSHSPTFACLLSHLCQFNYSEICWYLIKKLQAISVACWIVFLFSSGYVTGIDWEHDGGQQNWKLPTIIFQHIFTIFITLVQSPSQMRGQKFTQGITMKKWWRTGRTIHYLTPVTSLMKMTSSRCCFSIKNKASAHYE